MSGYLISYIIFSVVFGLCAWAIVRGGSEEQHRALFEPKRIIAFLTKQRFCHIDSFALVIFCALVGQQEYLKAGGWFLCWVMVGAAVEIGRREVADASGAAEGAFPADRFGSEK